MLTRRPRSSAGSHFHRCTKAGGALSVAAQQAHRASSAAPVISQGLRAARSRAAGSGRGAPPVFRVASLRSEEHTSELQSQSNLVCRLLLEKKKTSNVKAVVKWHTH